MSDRQPTGARESGEGDRFHVLWAVRRALGLLDPGLGLSSVQMEELTPIDVAKTDAALLSGVDLSEYYGGNTIDTANRVVVSQLKYSSRHPDQAWTAARIARASMSRGVVTRPSIAARLADIYRELRKSTNREDLEDVLEIVLVSNQPCSASLCRALEAAQSTLAGPSAPAGTATLLKRLAAKDRKEIRRLQIASGLKSREFIAFLRVFSLQLGQERNREQGFEVTKKLSQHVAADLRAHRLALYDLVVERGLVGGSGLPITAEDLLVAMDVGDRRTLFPAPAAFKLPADRVPTPDAERVLSALDAAPERRLIAHGSAGVGKTTTILDLERLLPEGSVVVRFDCFAGGSYMDPDKVRHQPEVALLQICNDIAVQSRLPLLLVRPHTQPEMWRLFADRIAQAQQLLDGLEARLVLVVDAADNSVWAAHENGGKSFVEELWRIDIPQNSGLIVTARTGRLDRLGARSDIARVKLKGFDPEGSAALLRTRFATATDAEANEFHVRSQGNPRAQSYVLDEERASTVTSPAAAAAQVEKTPEPVFRDLWETAVGHASDRSRAEERLAELVSIQRPVSLAVLAEATGAAVAEVRTFCNALVPGLRLSQDGEYAVLNDEDFEAYLKSRLTKRDFKAAHRRLADYFRQREQVDEYAATVVAGHLFRAGRRKQVRKLALERPAPEAVADPLLRRQVYLGRIRLALASCRPGADRDSAARLLMLAARASKADRAVQEAIVQRPALAVRFGDPSSVDEIWGDPSQIQYRGPLFVHLALKHAQAGHEQPARDALNMANAWLRRRHAESSYWRFDGDDRAVGYACRYFFDGWDAALTAALKSSSGSNASTSGMALVERLAAILRAQWSEIEPHVFSSRLPALFRARLLAAGCGPSAVAEEQPLRELAAALLRRPPRPDGRENKWRADFVELVARSTRDRQLALKVCRALAPAVPGRAPRDWGALGAHDPIVRARAMEAACQGEELTLDDVNPHWSEDQDQRTTSEQQTIMAQKVAPLLPLYLLRARAFVNEPAAVPKPDELVRQLERMESSTRDPQLRTGLTRAMWSVPIAQSLMALPTAHPDLVDQTATICGTHLYARTAMAEQLLDDARYRDQALDLIDKAATDGEALEQPAREAMEFLFDAAESVCGYDEGLAQDLFGRAVAAAAGMDDEGAVALEAHCRIAAACHGASVAPVLAGRLGDALARHKNRVSETDRLPWRETLAAVAHLHPPSGLGLLARWESEGSFSLSSGVGPCLSAELEAGFLTPDDVFALAALGDEQASRTPLYVALLKHVLEIHGRPAAAQLLERISVVVRRDLSGGGRRSTADGVAQWAHSVGLGSAAAVDALTAYRGPETDHPESTAAPERASSWNSPSGVVGALDDLAKAFRDLEAFESLGRDLATKAATRDRVEILDAVCALPAEHSLVRFHTEGLLCVVGQLLEAWDSDPVTRWRKSSLDSFVARMIPALVHYPAYERDPVAVLERIYSPTEAADVAVQAAGGWIGEVSSNGWFVLAGFVGAALPRRQATKFLDWSLAHFEDASTENDVLETQTRTATLAQFAFALFGHADRRVRWRMAHAFRGLIANDDGALVDALLASVDRRDAGAFADRRYPFLWQSAKTWAYMTIARAARDGAAISPEAASHLRQAALNTDWPHAAMREFARRATLVLDGEPLEDSPTTVGMANRPVACISERKSYWDREAFAMQTPKRWHFSLDTGAYWLGRVGEPFGLSKKSIASIADHWLVDRMGEDPDYRPPVDTRFEHVDHYATSNEQGSIPRYELGRIGLEYHAVQLVAGALADQRTAMRVPTYAEEGGPWIDWLDAHIDSVDGQWLSDVRDPTPPQSEYLEAAKTWPEIGDRAFEVMLGEPRSTGSIVVDAWTAYTRGEFGHGNDWVESALVARATSDSLVRALSDPQLLDRVYFAESADDFDPGDSSRDPFEFRAWLRAQGRLEKGLQDDDPLARVSPQVTLPADAFVADLGATVSDDRRSLWSGAKRIAWIRAFDDDPPAEQQQHQSHTSVSGQHTVVDLEALTRFLELNDSVLLVKCRVQRHSGYSAGGGHKDEHSKRRFYILDPERGLREVARAEEPRREDP